MTSDLGPYGIRTSDPGPYPIRTSEPGPYGIRPVPPHDGTLRAGPLPEESAAALDCLQTGLALLADHHHGRGTHLRLGVRPALRPRPAAPLPTVEASAADRLAEARRLLGLRVSRRHRVRTGRGLPPGPGPYYAVADAYHLPWVPYHGQRHMEHSFVVEYGAGRATVHDAYHNDTPWGGARPGAWTLPPPRLAALLAEAGAALYTLEPVPPDAWSTGPTGTAEEPTDPAAVLRYVGAYRDHPDRAAAHDRLNLEVWLGVRAWRLYALRTGSAEATGLAERWRRLSERVYLAARRTARGKDEPPGLFEEFTALLLADPAAAAAPAHPAEDGPGAREGRPPAGQGAEAPAERAERAVREALAAVLRLPPGEPADGRPFSSVPGFNSFRMVDILEHVESALGIEVPAGELTAGALRDAGTLRDLALRHLTAPAGAAGGGR
ncbi:acyl carrier protein [Streptomyces sp. NPDC058319]|uniref:acyl carrier protein n=1 Tax=unclassified Streptomyces TaxID=2593676 RepID=UPI0036E9EA70